MLTQKSLWFHNNRVMSTYYSQWRLQVLKKEVGSLFIMCYTVDEKTNKASKEYISSMELESNSTKEGTYNTLVK